MNIVANNKYAVENNVVLDLEYTKSLTLLYQPIIGAQALSLYFSFNLLLAHTTYSELCNYTGLDIECLERAIIMLERYRLLFTYKNEEEEYIHVLNKPLLPNDFLYHYVYGLELRQRIGNHQFNLLSQNFEVQTLNKYGYTDITETKVFNVNQFNEEDLKELMKAKDSNVVLSSKFNFDLFLKDATEIKFPSVLRTPENLNLIAELAMFYGISEERMTTLVYRSIDYIKMEFLDHKLIERVRREHVAIDRDIEKYSLPNPVFLQDLQNGASVSNHHKELLEELVYDKLLNPDVVNRLVEYVMETQNNRLVRNFVLQVASTWKTYDIKTVEEANQLIKQSSGAKYNNKAVKQAVVKREPVIVDDKNYSDDEREAIEENWRKLGEKYGAFEN